MQKILFLDVDGVLNNNVTLQKGIPVCPEKMSLLKAVTNITNCNIVLSSTWRLFPETRKELKIEFDNAQVPIWIDTTPSMPGPRSQEIQTWLKDNVKEIARVVIVDDEQDAEIIEQNTLFVQTSFEQGLTLDHVQTMVQFFQQGK